MADGMNDDSSMLVKLRLLIPLLMVCSTLSAANVASSTTGAITLRVPCFSDQRHKFYVHLLKSALDAIHQPSQISCVNDLPGRRMWKMVDEGKLDLIWGMQTPDKDRHMVPIPVDLTDGLAGQRILLIRPEDQKAFDAVTSAKTLRETTLVAGFGEGWFDAAVWKQNDLPVYEFPNRFALIYPMVMLGNRGVDYLPRGANEIVTDARSNKTLSVERNLLLYYDRDMRFYLSMHAVKYKPIIEHALQTAETTGLKRRLIDRTFGSDIKTLDLAHRRRIRLQSPQPDGMN